MTHVHGVAAFILSLIILFYNQIFIKNDKKFLHQKMQEQSPGY
ncbi:hypothetical protein Niako_4865 [Niastella koreensis GR20-10]|uniref:Uncharacterized protein n=1 Tax=Niastella koreensis (strain DSM 17620 / KACC 11465 / NBRC 106392 / GR20-10) TaxID=700598 RepID=G8TRI0_NIAKG|nr:hypothetical protein Niako_4865 [Niastella koreensis GR20-10]